ncbi:zinc finger MYM-type protein 1-like [Hydra vulgaris]|uniref:Zinc finger MYM-type protein 1-like n=1 Tax=Hydra vulgaris TaxID=6087 RepID=A0ABM4CA46_HYDVU
MLRKYESGACKRRLKKEREEMVAKLPKMTNFFSSNQTIMQFPQTVDNNKNNKKKDENNNTENEVACQGPSNEIQEVESVESTMHNNELDSDTILREDPALWPLQLKENERMKYLNKGHDGKSLITDILDLLERYDIDITNCRGQAYDNASNMSDKYSGLQARLKERSEIAFYIPCAGHSLNLVGQCSVSECINSINYFGVLQSLYSFFVASTHRWDLLKGNHATLKRLSDTRWSCRSDASKCLVENFDGTHVEDTEEKSDTRHEALCLLNKITKLEFAFMAVLWHHILKRFNAVSKFLQKVELNLHKVSSMLLSLIYFVKNLRNDFTRFENESKKLSSFIEKDYSDKNKRKVIKKLSNGENQLDSLRVSDKFLVNTFFVIIDKLVTQLTIRSDGYSHVNKLFGFLSKLLTISTMELQVSAKKIVGVYSNDLEDSFIFEIEQFVTLLKLKPPAYRLFLTIPITNCEAEGSFSTLKRVKNMHRSTMVHSRLSNIARLTIESKLLETLDFSDRFQENLVSVSGTGPPTFK